MGHGCCGCSKVDDCCPEEPTVGAAEGNDEKDKEKDAGDDKETETEE